MPLLIIGLILNLLYCIFYLPTLNIPILTIIGIGSVVVAIVGAVLTSSDSTRKLGGILAIAGSVMFVPLGLVAMFGAKKVMRPSPDDALSARRKAARGDTGSTRTDA